MFLLFEHFQGVLFHVRPQRATGPLIDCEKEQIKRNVRYLKKKSFKSSGLMASKRLKGIDANRFVMTF